MHKTDILAVAYGSPHLLATASFCGKVSCLTTLHITTYSLQIAVWSLISYRILNELKAEYPLSAGPPPSTCRQLNVGCTHHHKGMYIDANNL